MILPNGASSIPSHGRMAIISQENNNKQNKFDDMFKEDMLQAKMLESGVRAHDKLVCTKNT